MTGCGGPQQPQGAPAMPCQAEACMRWRDATAAARWRELDDVVNFWRRRHRRAITAAAIGWGAAFALLAARIIGGAA